MVTLVLRSRGLLALTLTLTSLLAACGTAPVAIRRPSASVAVWMNANATAAQVVSVRTKLKHMPEVVSCSYLDHQASYGEMEALIAMHVLPSSFASILSPTTSPPVFDCKVQRVQNRPGYHPVPGKTNGHDDRLGSSRDRDLEDED